MARTGENIYKRKDGSGKARYILFYDEKGKAKYRYVYDNWVWKSDCCSETNIEAQKGEASDAFKRACFNWGIGRELYTAPFIYVPADRGNIFNDKCFDKFVVERIKIVNKYIAFAVLKKIDSTGLTIAKKIKAIFEFRIPYFVGPLNRFSDKSWFVRKIEGKIYSWNFEGIVDFDKLYLPLFKNLQCLRAV